MTFDHTQQQTAGDVERSKELSLAQSRPPAEVPGYEAESLLGRGAYGEVWIGVDRNTGRRVAIKFYTHRSGVDWTLLSREVEKLVYLSADRYVVQLLQVGWESEPPYYVMEYVENGSLDNYLRESGPLGVAEAAELFRDLAVGLVHAHGKGVLHCDLKPANILLDQDHRPRLADFGQSRLSHEQSPALGTLFYMAPEQADLEAVPDARWDVYAVGAILYRMLTGDPPFRNDQTLSEIEKASDLPERLAKYREILRNAPPPTLHRRVKGMDRALSEIIDRCLAVDPDRRFANVQEILDALQTREAARRRRPLVLSGFVGPALLLLVMILFGLRGYEHAVQDSENFVSLRARESNEFAAKFAARSIEGEIARYFRVVRLEAESPELLERFIPIADSQQVHELNDPSNTPEKVAELRERFLRDSARGELNRYLQDQLQRYLDRLLEDNRELKFSSVLALDSKGRMLAVAYDEPVDRVSVGWNFSYRSYFHGGPADLDLPSDVTPANVRPISDTHLSSAYRSSTSGVWKVAVSTPIFRTSGNEKELGDPSIMEPAPKRGLALHWQILIGMLIGAGGGLTARAVWSPASDGTPDPTLAWLANNIADPLGQIFLRLIFMVVIPLVFCALTLAVAELGDLRSLGRIGLKTLLFTLVLSSASVAIGLSAANLVKPGLRMDEAKREELRKQSQEKPPDAVKKAESAKSLRDTLLDIIPRNPLQEMVGALDGSSPGGGMLAVMFFALAFGIAISFAPERTATLVAVLQGTFDAVMVIIQFTMRLAPLAVAGFMFKLTGLLGFEILQSLAWYVGTVIGALALQLLVVYPIVLFIFARRSPLQFFSQVSDAMMTAFATSSSNATLPTAIRVAEEKVGLRPKIARFVLTVGSTANQNGTALYEGVTVLFLAQVFGVTLDPMQQFTVVLMSVLAGVGTAGVPGGSLPLVVLVLQSVEIPAYGIGIILGVDRLLDMCRTTLNVTGDIAVAACVDRSEPDGT